MYTTYQPAVRIDVRKTARVIAYAVIFISIFALFIHWSLAHDAAMDSAMTKYEACVQAQYHTTPAAYYQEHGETPTCN